MKFGDETVQIDPEQFSEFVVKGERLRIAYARRAGTGRALLFIHGMGSSRLAFLPQLHALHLANPLYAMDLPGFGASTLPRVRQQLPDFVLAVMGFVESLRLDRPILVGHSFGGLVAAESAISAPDRIAGTVLAASAGWCAPEGAFEPTRWVWLNRLGIWITSSNRVGDRILAGLGVDPKCLTAEDRQRLRYGWRRAREMARMGRFYRTERMAERLQAAGVPTVVIAGRRDTLFPLSKVIEAVGGRFPLWTMEQGGHLVLDQDRAVFLALLEQAVTELQGGGARQ